jgi:riboflavin synthase
VKRIGVVDTTFSRVNMGKVAVEALRTFASEQELAIDRATVPGIKDLPVAVRRMFREKGSDLVMALGMAGAAPVDKTCAHEASQGLMHVGILEVRPILEVFVHMDEAKHDQELAWLARRRAEEHAENAYLMLFHPEKLVERAGQGLRQGFADAGPIVTE